MMKSMKDQPGLGNVEMFDRDALNDYASKYEEAEDVVGEEIDPAPAPAFNDVPNWSFSFLPEAIRPAATKVYDGLNRLLDWVLDFASPPNSPPKGRSDL